MAYQNFFNKISEITNFNCLESEMFEIIDAYRKDLNFDKDLFGGEIPKIYFLSSDTKNDNGFMQMHCGLSSIDNKSYVVTTHNLHATDIPDLCTDAKTFSELVAKLLNEYYNK